MDARAAAEEVRDTPAAVVSRGADGVLLVVLSLGARMDGVNTALLVAALRELAPGGPRPTLADIRGVRDADKQAREVAAGPEAAAAIERLALVVGSPLTRVVGTFFLRVTSPEYPTRVFDDPDEARRWLLDEGAASDGERERGG